MDTNALSIDFPPDLLDSARMSKDDLKLELALHLYSTGRMSQGKARELAGLSLWQFRNLLAERSIPVHYDEMDQERDLETLKHLERRDCSQQLVTAHQPRGHWSV